MLVGATDWNCVLVHTVYGMHTRSLLAVGAVQAQHISYPINVHSCSHSLPIAWYADAVHAGEYGKHGFVDVVFW